MLDPIDLLLRLEIACHERVGFVTEVERLLCTVIVFAEYASKASLRPGSIKRDQFI